MIQAHWPAQVAWHGIRVDKKRHFQYLGDNESCIDVTKICYIGLFIVCFSKNSKYFLKFFIRQTGSYIAFAIKSLHVYVSIKNVYIKLATFTISITL
jgi:hypothetical protein